MSSASSFTQEEARVCTTCGVEKPLSEFHVRPDRSHVPKTKCKDCQAEYLRGWRSKQPPGYAKKYREAMSPAQLANRLSQNRAWKFRTKYGITLEEFASRLRRQKGRCAICQATVALRQHGEGKGCRQGSAVVDHDHKTGRVRGILCGNCNLLLGYVEDDVATLEAAIRYLKECA